MSQRNSLVARQTVGLNSPAGLLMVDWRSLGEVGRVSKTRSGKRNIRPSGSRRKAGSWTHISSIWPVGKPRTLRLLIELAFTTADYFSGLGMIRSWALR